MSEFRDTDELLSGIEDSIAKVDGSIESMIDVLRGIADSMERIVEHTSNIAQLLLGRK